MKRIALTLGAWMLAATANAAEPRDPRPLFETYRCNLCHADNETKAGPAFRDVAMAYRGQRGAHAQVARAIKRGQHGGGWWHMPPHPEASDAEVAAMTRYILSLK
jgi:cytochrome c